MIAKNRRLTGESKVRTLPRLGPMSWIQPLFVGPTGAVVLTKVPGPNAGSKNVPAEEPVERLEAGSTSPLYVTPTFPLPRGRLPFAEPGVPEIMPFHSTHVWALAGRAKTRTPTAIGI